MNSKNYACAEQSYLKVGQLTDDKTEKFNGLANIQLNLKNFDKAHQYLQQANEIDPNECPTAASKGP